MGLKEELKALIGRTTFESWESYDYEMLLKNHEKLIENVINWLLLQSMDEEDTVKTLACMFDGLEVDDGIGLDEDFFRQVYRHIENQVEADRIFSQPLPETKLYRDEDRKEVYAFRHEAADDAFDMLISFRGADSGGIDAPPHCIGMETRDCDEFSLIKFNFKNSETCGLSDCRYHTYYNGNDIYSDVYKVDKDGNITCLVGEETSVTPEGENSVFRMKYVYADGHEELGYICDGFEECHEQRETFEESCRYMAKEFLTRAKG